MSEISERETASQCFLITATHNMKQHHICWDTMFVRLKPLRLLSTCSYWKFGVPLQLAFWCNTYKWEFSISLTLDCLPKSHLISQRIPPEALEQPGKRNQGTAMALLQQELPEGQQEQIRPFLEVQFHGCSYGWGWQWLIFWSGTQVYIMRYILITH